MPGLPPPLKPGMTSKELAEHIEFWAAQNPNVDLETSLLDSPATTEARYLYQKVAADLRRSIEAGIYRSQLPPEHALQEKYGISGGTLREAIRVLVDEGLVLTRQGRGTFVNPKYRF